MHIQRDELLPCQEIAGFQFRTQAMRNQAVDQRASVDCTVPGACRALRSAPQPLRVQIDHHGKRQQPRASVVLHIHALYLAHRDSLQIYRRAGG